MWTYFFKILGWYGMVLLKFLFTPFLMILNPGGHETWTWAETILIVSTGAALWAFVFFHFGEFIFNWLSHHLNSKRRIFTRRNRWFVRIKKRWGLKGLLLISGVISVPIASVLCAKLYRHNSTALPKLIIAFFAWTVVLTSIAFGMKMIGKSL